jgi:L-lactate permease
MEMYSYTSKYKYEDAKLLSNLAETMINIIHAQQTKPKQKQNKTQKKTTQKHKKNTHTHKNVPQYLILKSTNPFLPVLSDFILSQPIHTEKTNQNQKHNTQNQNNEKIEKFILLLQIARHSSICIFLNAIRFFQTPFPGIYQKTKIKSDLRLHNT